MVCCSILCSMCDRARSRDKMLSQLQKNRIAPASKQHPSRQRVGDPAAGCTSPCARPPCTSNAQLLAVFAYACAAGGGVQHAHGKAADSPQRTQRAPWGAACRQQEGSKGGGGGGVLRSKPEMFT